MATTQCCICGRKIGRFDKLIELSPTTPGLAVCYYCNEDINQVKQPLISEDQFMARHAQQSAMHNIAEAICDDTIDNAAKEVILDGLADREIAGLIKALSEGKRESAKKAAEAEQRYKESAHKILTTTAYQFEGYRIVDYHGVFSGDCVIGTGVPTDIAASLSDLIGDTSKSLADKLKAAKSMAMNDLVKQAMFAGGNAIVAVQYNIYPYGSMLGVTVSGTSVTVEKM